MRNIYFTREPACTYDLFFIFGLYFNQEYYINNFVNYQKAVQDTEFYKALLSEIGEVPEELRPFFRVKDDGKCFMTKMYFDRYEDILNTSYCLASVQEDLMNIPELTGFLLDYYFPERENREDFNLTQLSALIRKSSYEAATIQDLERAMGLSGTNAYYHLTILIKANVVRTRNQGRLVIYSLNREYFDFV